MGATLLASGWTALGSCPDCASRHATTGHRIHSKSDNSPPTVGLEHRGFSTWPKLGYSIKQSDGSFFYMNGWIAEAVFSS